MDITLKVKKDDVYREVAQTTSYTGAKMDDENAYDRIFTTDEDQSMLLRFWNESRNMMCQNLKRVLGSETEREDGTWEMTLHVSEAFDMTLKESMQSSLFSFFVMSITSKWYTFTNKGESDGYAAEAAACIDDIRRKAFYKTKPVRPTYQR